MEGKKPTQQAAPGTDGRCLQPFSVLPPKYPPSMMADQKSGFHFRPNRFGLLTQQARNHLEYGSKDFR